MADVALPRPEGTEYNEYYRRYIDLVPQGNIVAIMAEEMDTTQALLASVTREQEEFRYAPGKWSLREVVGHLMDTERVFAFRALWFARGAREEMAGMDQNAWAETSSAGRRPLRELAREWAALREANTYLFGSFDAETGLRRGVASGYEVTVRALPWMIVGHELHHRTLIQRDYLGLTP